MSQLTLTPNQLTILGDVLKKLSDLSAETGINFDAYGSWDIEYANSFIHITKSKDGQYQVDNYCG